MFPSRLVVEFEFIRLFYFLKSISRNKKPDLKQILKNLSGLGKEVQYATRRSENRRNVNKVNMSQIWKRTRPFCHTRESGYLVGFFPDSLLDSCLPRNDDEEGIRTEVDLKSTCFRNPSPSRRRRFSEIELSIRELSGGLQECRHQGVHTGRVSI